MMNEKSFGDNSRVRWFREVDGTLSIFIGWPTLGDAKMKSRLMVDALRIQMKLNNHFATFMSQYTPMPPTRSDV